MKPDDDIPFGEGYPDPPPLYEVTTERLQAVLSGASDECHDVQVVPVDEFAQVDEEGAAAILGTADNALIPEGGDAMIYGDGGVGKTTLALDFAFHVAAGIEWLGIPVARPVRVLLIENEGPRPLFRRKAERKQAAWEGPPVADRLLVWEDPWGAFTFARADWRLQLAQVVRAREIDLTIIGPLTSSGMEAAGTLQEVREFLALVNDVRAKAERRFANLLIHHENRATKVSGAWEGAGDTLLHVQQQGHGKLRVYVQKARWASDQHATSLQLAWAAGDGFALTDAEPSRPERAWEDIAAFVLAHGGCGWNKVTDAVPGQKDYLTRRRDQMLEDGILINAGTAKSFKLWHREDPARPTLDDGGSPGGTSRELPDSAPTGGDHPRTWFRGSPLKGEPRPGEPPVVPEEPL